jgi:hypothetical protein
MALPCPDLAIAHLRSRQEAVLVLGEAGGGGLSDPVDPVLVSLERSFYMAVEDTVLPCLPCPAMSF